MSFPYSDPFSSNPSSANHSLTIHQIIETIPSLIDLISKAKLSIPNSKPTTNNNNTNVVGANSGGSNSNAASRSGGSSGGAEKEKEGGDKNAGGCWSLGFFDGDKEGTTKNGGRRGNGGSSSSTGGGGSSSDQVNLRLYNELEKLLRDLVYIKGAFSKLKNLEESVSVQFNALQLQGQSLESIFSYVSQVPNGTFPEKPVQAKIRLLSEMVLKLKLQIPSPHKMSLPNSEAYRPETGNDISAHKLIDETLKLHESEKFRSSSAFKEFRESYKKLHNGSKLCLLCFAIFPENAVVTKRLLAYWWVGEGFVDPPVNEVKTIEEISDEILKEFLAKGFIEPVIKKRRLVGFRMHPLMRYAVIILAKEMEFLKFDSFGNPVADFSSTLRACLVKTEEGTTRQVIVNSDPEKLQSLFNVNDPYPDFKLEWFSRMKNVNVLHLGKWQSSAMHHIEVEDTEFLRGLRNMKNLRFLSLQGISRIIEIPDSIWKLANLRILDLNACHNLESLPDQIASLKMLTHLDVSECYLLDHMPKGIEFLSELQVLKGFVISDLMSKSSCTLEDLAKLGKLRKLSIHTSKKNFPEKEELNALQHLGALRKLTVAWAGTEAKSEDSSRQENVPLTQESIKNPNNSVRSTKQDNVGAQPAKDQSGNKRLTRVSAFRRDNGLTSELPANLEKLDLQCFPETNAPNWLMPGRLRNLKKLYIRGGNLQNLGQVQKENDKWTVKILRLKFLLGLKMNWRELQNSFPDLIYLEKVRCPKLTLFPCDESGVWLNRKMVTKELLENELEFSWSFLANRST